LPTAFFEVKPPLNLYFLSAPYCFLLIERSLWSGEAATVLPFAFVLAGGRFLAAAGLAAGLEVFPCAPGKDL
jgi:hypothetical protein